MPQRPVVFMMVPGSEVYMGLLKSIGDFLFGKEPDIFDDKGRVTHKLPKKTWDAWHNRTKMDPSNNWRNHTGVTGKNLTEDASKKSH